MQSASGIRWYNLWYNLLTGGEVDAMMQARGGEAE